MKAVYIKSKKKKSKYSSSSHSIDIEKNEVLSFSDLDSLNNKNNLKKVTEITRIGKAEIIGGFSGCHKINDDIFMIDFDQDGLTPNIRSVKKNKKFVGILINCGMDWVPNDFFETSLESKKESFEFNFKIKSNKLIFFGVNDSEINKKEKLASNVNNFIKDKTKNNKFLEFKVAKGKYNIYTFYSDGKIRSHFIELENKEN